MRNAIPILACCLAVGPGCKEEPANPKVPAAAPATPTAPKTVEQVATRGPTTDLKDIQGKWETIAGDPVQAEFSGDTIVLRSGPGPDWKETTRATFKLNDQTLLRQIDWGEGATAAKGLYTIDGKNMMLNYVTGAGAERLKNWSKKPPAVQLEMKRVP